MDTATRDDLRRSLQEIRDAGLWKDERELTSPQSAHVATRHSEALNFCANNYLRTVGKRWSMRHLRPDLHFRTP